MAKYCIGDIVEEEREVRFPDLVQCLLRYCNDILPFNSCLRLIKTFYNSERRCTKRLVFLEQGIINLFFFYI